MEDTFSRRSFLDPNIYSLAFDTALKLFALSNSLPQDGPNSLPNRIVHSSGAVCLNIAQAWQNMENTKIFIDKLNYASIEAGEAQDQIEHAVECSYLRPDEGRELNNIYDHIIEIIADMIKENQF